MSSRPIGLATAAGPGLLLGFAYLVLVGGTVVGELNPAFWLVGAAIVGTCLVAYVVRAPAMADRFDRHVLFALLLFLAAATLSHTPRQSFDAALLVLGYAAALFVARGLLASAQVRSQLITTLVILSAVLTLVTATRWIPQYIEWWALTGRTVIPPLNLEFIAVPWGHRYDLVTALTLLYPAWWIGPSSAVRRALGTVIGVLVLLLLVITGSRALWLAVGIASLALVAPHLTRAWRSSRTIRLAIGFGAPLAGFLLLVSGGMSLLASRATSLDTLSYRSAMWAPLTEIWAAHPLAGYGPGSMPWILQMTDYFDANWWEPRHPDSVPVQLLAEVGFLGMAAVAVLLVAIVPAILRGSLHGARWALSVFAIGSVLSSPTEFPYIMAIVVAWVAFALPRPSGATVEWSERGAAFLTATGVAIAIIALAYLATFLAATSYDRARSMIDEGQLSDAREALDQAVALDPGLAIYARQRGTVSLLQGDPQPAIEDLRLATELNPSDDLAWRTLSLAYEMAGAPDSSGAAMAQAVDRQRTDLTNLLLQARFLGSQDRTAEASQVLVEVVQSAPAIIAAPGWIDLLPTGTETSDIVELAAEPWAQASEAQQLPVSPALWLGVLAGRDDLVDRVLSLPSINTVLAEATVALLSCQAADAELATAPEDARRTQEYWALRLWADANAGRSTDLAWRVLAIMRGDFDTVSGALGTMNPLDENGATSADVWGYRRYPIHWPDAPFGLPSPEAGLRHWLTDSAGAVRDAGMQDRLPGCD